MQLQRYTISSSCFCWKACMRRQQLQGHKPESGHHDQARDEGGSVAVCGPCACCAVLCCDTSARPRELCALRRHGVHVQHGHVYM